MRALQVSLLTRDGYLLIAARGLRLFAYGLLSVIFALYLTGLGFSIAQTGALFTVALAGGALTSAVVSLLADRWGRRRWLVVSALAMTVAGVALAMSDRYWMLLLVAALGALSPSGQEVGPFQPLEQAALSQTLTDPGRTLPYAWYNLAGSLAVALGALTAGLVPLVLEGNGWAPLGAQRVLIWIFAGMGLVLALVFALLSPAIEVPSISGESLSTSHTGLHRSRGIVLRLSALFGVDALAGGLVVQSLVAFWFSQRFGVGLEILGPIFFGTNVLSAVSYLIAARLADRFGLLNTMVFTHLPSNVLLALVPFMPSWQLAAGLLLARHLLSQMDVPTRQAYTMILVAPEERAAAAGLTAAVRPAASSVAPLLSGVALQTAALGLPFILAGGLKIAYDLALWATFRKVSANRAGESSPITKGV
jgi:MFS family permease